MTNSKFKTPENGSSQGANSKYSNLNDSPSRLPEFNIFDHLETLKIVKETLTEYHCLCPVCGDGGFKISKRDGKFNAFKCECDIPSIREAIRPLNQAFAEYSWEKPLRRKQTRKWQYGDRTGKPQLTVKRVDDGNGKSEIFREPTGVDNSMLTPYNWSKVQKALEQGEIVFIVEGEPCVDAMVEIGLNAISFCGGSNSPHYKACVDLLQPHAAQLVICPDRDQSGIKYAQTVAGLVGITQWMYAFPNSSQWQHTLSTKDGADVADWIADGAKSEDILATIGPQRTLLQQHNQQKLPNIVDPPGRVDYKLIRKELVCLITEEVAGAKLRQKLAQIAADHRCNPQQVEKLYKELLQEHTHKVDVQAAAVGLREIATIRSVGLAIELGLHGDGGHLARQLKQVADAMPTAVEFLITTLIPATASRIGTSSRLVISATAGYIAVMVFRTIIVADTGRKKTPAQSTIMDVLASLEETHQKRYELEKAQYEATLKQYENSSKKGVGEPKPQPPIRKRYFSNDDTVAARIQIHSENPRGLLLYRDEASAFMTERGRFTNGKGDNGDAEADLSEFNGKSLSRDRKTDGSTFMKRTAISRTGAIQFAKLQALMGTHQDDCGEWARYLFCAAESPPSYIDLTKDVGDLGLQKSVVALIEKLDQLPEQDYHLSNPAKKAFMRYQHHLTDQAIDTDHPSLQSAFPKFETYFGRFCLWLHIVNEVLAGRQPELTISAETVALAQEWTEYYIGQLKLILALNSPQQELTSDLLKLHSYLERKGEGKTPRQIAQAGVFAKDKRKTPYIKELLNTLVQKGWATVEGNIYTAVPPKT